MDLTLESGGLRSDFLKDDGSHVLAVLTRPLI